MQVEVFEDGMEGFGGELVEASEGGGGWVLYDRCGAGCFGGTLIERTVESEEIGVDGAIADVAAGVSQRAEEFGIHDCGVRWRSVLLKVKGVDENKW